MGGGMTEAHLRQKRGSPWCDVGWAVMQRIPISESVIARTDVAVL